MFNSSKQRSPSALPYLCSISIAVLTALSHLDNRNTYVRMLFIDYSSAFNTLVPSKLITKLRTLGLNTSLCNWILDFLTGRLQVVRVGNNPSTHWRLKRFGIGPRIYKKFYSCPIKRILTGCITAW